MSLSAGGRCSHSKKEKKLERKIMMIHCSATATGTCWQHLHKFRLLFVLFVISSIWQRRSSAIPFATTNAEVRADTRGQRRRGTRRRSSLTWPRGQLDLTLVTSGWHLDLKFFWSFWVGGLLAGFWFDFSIFCIKKWAICSHKISRSFETIEKTHLSRNFPFFLWKKNSLVMAQGGIGGEG